MATSIKWYRQAFKSAFLGDIKFTSDNIKVALVKDTYVLDQDGDVAYSDISGEEVSGDGYTAGGATLGTPTVTTPASKTVMLDGEDTSWPSSVITARGAVVYNNTPASKPLICFVDFGEDIISIGGDFRIIWNASGIVDVVVE